MKRRLNSVPRTVGCWCCRAHHRRRPAGWLGLLGLLVAVLSGVGLLALDFYGFSLGWLAGLMVRRWIRKLRLLGVASHRPRQPILQLLRRTRI